MLRVTLRAVVAGESKKTCCRSTPRCAGCPVLAARARRRAQSGSGGWASLFEEVYGARSNVLPLSVTEALAGYSLHRNAGSTSSGAV
jgi:hypothetical protein